MGPKKLDALMQNRFFWGSKMLFIFVLFWVASKTAQEGPKGAQDAPGSPPECLKMAQEVPKSTPGGSKRASRDPKSRSRGFETLKIAPTFSKSYRIRVRSLKSTYPTGLAPDRRKKKGGRAAVIPLGEVNPPPAPEGRSRACQTDLQKPKPQAKSCLLYTSPSPRDRG